MGGTVVVACADQDSETITPREVICIFCGSATPLPASVPRGRASHVARNTRGISIVRCDVCGKEAYGIVPNQHAHLRESLIFEPRDLHAEIARERASQGG